MIDSNFIIRYTNGLYYISESDRPSYDEFRDMFSSGQLKSKQWLVDELSKLRGRVDCNSIAIAGSWFGTLGLMLHNTFSIDITLIDIDPRCEQFVDCIMHDLTNITCVTQDMYDYPYTEDIIVNTSCEHIPDLSVWLKNVPPSTTVILQSNNYTTPVDHINCVNSKQEFIDKSGLSNILYSGELTFPMYTRYMIIGRT